MKRLFMYLPLLLRVTSICAQSGTVFDNETFKSTILNEERKYAVYLPPHYDSSKRSYPVLYLLHPAGPKGTLPNQQGWINYGNLKFFMDDAINRGEITPMIVVTPDANCVRHISYFNDPNRHFDFEHFFWKSLFLILKKHTDAGGIEIAER